MGVVRFCVVLDKPDKVYYPGEMVTGRVELVLDSIMKIRGVELKIKGRAKCKWDESETYHDNEGKSQTRTTCRKSSETYLKNEQILTGGRDKFELPAGEHRYSFAVMLPMKAPSSFSGSYGGISYYGKAKIDIPLAFDKKERTGFTVICPLNLNLFPNLRTPYKNEKDKTFCCLCCASGPLTIVVHLPKTGFATSESIPITLEVDNASNVTVNAVHVYLKRTIGWIADGCHKNEDLKLQKLRLGGVEDGQSHTWCENFTIPPTSFPYLDCCSIIRIDHELHIEADALGMHSDLDMHIPLTIGDIPLSEDSNVPIVAPQMQTFPNNMAYNPGMQIPAGGVLSSYPNQNPPVMNYPYPGNAVNAPYGIPPLQICPPAPPGYIVSQPGMNNAPRNYPNVGGMSQSPIQEHSLQNYFAGTYPPQGNFVYGLQYPTQASSPECSQSQPHPPVTFTDAGDDLALPSFNSALQSEKTKSQNAENSTDTMPLLPPSSSASPSS